MQNFLIKISSIFNVDINYTTMNVTTLHVYANYIRTKLGYFIDYLAVRDDVIEALLAEDSELDRLGIIR